MQNKQSAAKRRERRNSVMAEGYASGTDCFVESGSGAMIYDMEGREYIDFAGGIGVMNVGHSHPKVVAAIQEQAAKFTHTCFMVLPYMPAAELAEKLCDIGVYATNIYAGKIHQPPNHDKSVLHSLLCGPVLVLPNEHRQEEDEDRGAEKDAQQGFV